jgi:hypothetical protein
MLSHLLDRFLGDFAQVHIYFSTWLWTLLILSDMLHRKCRTWWNYWLISALKLVHSLHQSSVFHRQVLVMVSSPFEILIDNWVVMCTLFFYNLLQKLVIVFGIVINHLRALIMLRFLHVRISMIRGRAICVPLLWILHIFSVQSLIQNHFSRDNCILIRVFFLFLAVRRRLDIL